MLSLEEALTGLSENHERQARVAEMRLFAGMTMQEIATMEKVTDRTIKNDWRVARAWLADALDRHEVDRP
jgi:DNA-directed RNA polymerase specialized sigma24 family protein